MKVSEAPTFLREMPDETEFRRWRKLMPGSCEASYTYFARGERTGLIKIGCAWEPSARMQGLALETAQDMTLLATVRSGDFELCYHRLFERHRLHGEWFSPHPDILAEIDRLKEPT